MSEFLEYAGRGARVLAAVLAWGGVIIAVALCSPFFVLGWLSYRFGWID